MVRKLQYGVFIVLATLLLLGCGAGAENNTQQIQGDNLEDIQVIVKFREPLDQDSLGNKILAVSRELKKPVEYLRPMSGEAHLILIRGIIRDDIPQLLQKLQSQGDIEYAVEDIRLSHQNKPDKLKAQ